MRVTVEYTMPVSFLDYHITEKNSKYICAHNFKYCTGVPGTFAHVLWQNTLKEQIECASSYLLKFPNGGVHIYERIVPIAVGLESYKYIMSLGATNTLYFL